MAVKYRRVSPDMRVDRQSADISTESRPTYRPSIGRYIDRLSVDISADCRSTYRPRVSTDTRSTDALSTHDPKTQTTEKLRLSRCIENLDPHSTHSRQESGTRGDNRVCHLCSYHILTSSVISY